MTSVDVIVPCYRYGHFLKECVESILAQSGINVRILVIDDASPDNTPEVAAELAQMDSRVTVLRHSMNRGHIATYNEGIDYASADYFLLLSADDYLLPGALHRASSLMSQHPAVGFVFGNAINLDNAGNRVHTGLTFCKSSEGVLSGREFIRMSGARNIVPTPTAVVRTEVQKRVGGYRPELPHAGDMEMWLRLAAHASVGFVSEPQAVYRRHDRNMSLSYMEQSWFSDVEQRRKALRCFFQSCEGILAHSSQLQKRLSYLLALDAISKASTAFNAGELELCKRLADLAVRISPQSVNSLAWVKLTLKRKMGPGVWQAMQSIRAHKFRHNRAHAVDHRSGSMGVQK